MKNLMITLALVAPLVQAETVECHPAAMPPHVMTCDVPSGRSDPMTPEEAVAARIRAHAAIQQLQKDLRDPATLQREKDAMAAKGQNRFSSWAQDAKPADGWK